MSIRNISALCEVAYLRVFIIKTAEFAYNDMIEEKFGSEHRAKLDELYSLLKSTCLDAESQNLSEFFLRQFIRNYGLSSLRKLIAKETFQWLWPEEDSEVCFLPGGLFCSD